MNESNVRIIINELLKKSDWILPGSDGVVNVDTEVQNQSGIADYILKDKSDFPLCVIEAKKEMISPLIGKEQARGYANSLNCRFVILSNGVSHYFWDIEKGNPNIIDVYPTQEQLILRQDDFNPNRDNTEEIDEGYIANTQFPDYKLHPDYNNLIADLRYGTLPYDDKSLWGIEIDYNEPDNHVSFKSIRNFNDKVYNEFWNMLKGNLK